MNISNPKEYYQMSEKQFKEMKKFYKKLGFDDSQVKKLTKSCFGAEIKTDPHTSYSEDWSFYRRTGYSPKSGGILGMMGSAMQAKRGVSSSMPSPMMRQASAAVFEEAVMCDMNVAYDAGEIPTADNFNTAETHVSPENEKHSPLDNPQLIFSANVNTASWSYLRNRITRQKTIDENFVRIEEIINSYSYKLKKPKNDDLFAVSAETGKCPWNSESELLFVGLKGKKADKKIRQNLTFLVDVSGSMDSNWILVQMSMAAIISKLKKGDTLSIIAYSDNTTTVVKQMDCGNLDDCIKAVLSIEGIGGCTNGSEGLENAYRYLEEHYDADGNNRVFIFTDGDFNFGITSEGGLKDFIYEKRKTGIYLSIVGYGERNFKDNKMETLAQNGNGNYTFVANPYDILDNLWEKLVSSLVTVAKDVKISVELNPQYVSRYRLIGYDARVLTQQEFHDTEKATDGIGSEHNVVAMIELKRGKAEQVYANRYVNASTDEHTGEFAFIEIHYKSPEGENLVMTRTITIEDLNSAKNKNISIAAMLAVFGLVVKNSVYKKDADKELLAGLLESFDKEDEPDTKEKYSHFDIIRQYIGNY